MATADEHLQALLRLPVEDRARAAKRLLESLDLDADDPTAAALRIEELSRRAHEIATGTVELVDAADARQRVVQRLRDVRGE